VYNRLIIEEIDFPNMIEEHVSGDSGGNKLVDVSHPMLRVYKFLLDLHL
jgi:hypothetical protein